MNSSLKPPSVFTQYDNKTKYSSSLRILSFTLKLNSNSLVFLREFQQLTSAFQSVGEENKPNVEYEALIQNSKNGRHLLAKHGKIVYETPNWVEVLLVLQEHFLNDFIKSTRDQYYLLHSAVLVKKRKAVVFPGVSKSGKSTISIALLKDGFKYLSDEIAAINLSTLRATGFPRAIVMREKTLSLFPNLGPEINHLRYELLNSGKVREIHYGIPSGKNLATMNKSFPISAIVFPHYKWKGDACLCEIKPPSESLFDLMQCSLNQRRLKEKGFKTAARLVRQAKCYSLQTKDLAKACEIINGLV